MENNNNSSSSNKVLLPLVIVLSILVVGVIGYLFYDKAILKTNNETQQSQNNNSQIEENQIDVSESGKVYVKRNGTMSLESVPSNLVGTYENIGGGYFTINSDGTLYILEYNGDSDDHNGKSIYDKDNSSFQITYISNSEDIILEIYTKTNNGWLPSPFRLGRKDYNGNYSFALLENTPSANANEFVYIKK